MVTKTYTFTGPVRYAKVWPAQVDRKFQTEGRGGNWSVIMNLPDSQAKLYNALGTKTKAVSEQDVAIFKIKKPDAKNPPQVNDVTFRRYERHPVLGDLGSPAVLGVSDGESIGNDSICTAVVEVYPYTFEGSTGFATRLVSLEVNTLVPYVKPAATGDEPPVH